MALSVLIWSTASHYPAGIFTLFFYTIEIYRIVSFWYNCVLWTVQINWKHSVNKTKKKQKQQHNMCWIPIYVNKNKQRKQDRCLFFFSPWHYLSLFDLRFRYFCLISCGGVQHILCCCWFFSAACLPYVSSLSTLSTKHSCIKNWQSYIFQLYKRKVWRYQRDSVKP
jgi:hypothetical protein